jgi:hydroxyacylglutathione hydrolase
MNNCTYEIYQLEAGSPILPNYMYIIVDSITRKTAIVDPGWDLHLITSRFDELGVKPSLILLTHSHLDHVNMVGALVERYGSSVYMSGLECDYYQFHAQNLIRFEDKDVLFLGNTRIECLVTPGHTAGGSCFLLTDSFFTGDTVFIEGCGMCNKEGGSPEKMFESFQRIKRTVAPHIRVYPGHSYGKAPGCRLVDLEKYNVYFLINSKEHFVNLRMRENQQHSLYVRLNQ